jgi:ABC-2 type transport system permease protein
MKKFLKEFFSKKGFIAFFNRKKFKYGGYSVALTLIVIALVVLVNVGFTTLDSFYSLKFDLSQNQTYTITPQSQNILASLDEDIYIYTLYPVNEEDTTIQEILGKYKSYSSHVYVRNVDPSRNPTFVNPFDTDGTGIEDGSIIVTNADHSRFRVLDKYDQYKISYNYNSSTYSYDTTVDSITVESALPPAVLYITSDEVHRALFLTGHGEPSASDTTDLRNILTDINYDVEDYNILTTDEGIQAGDIIIVLAPTSDISDDEREILKGYIESGGRFLFAFNPLAGRLENFESLLELYGITLKHGVIMEGNRSYYALPSAYYLLPKINSHDITSAILNTNISMIMPAAGAVVAPDVVPATNITIESLLTTSDQAWLEPTDTQDTTQNGDEPLGPFDLGLAVTVKDSSNSDNNVQFLVFDNAAFMQYVSQFTTFSNEDFITSCMQWLSGGTETVFIRGKVLDSPLLYFDNATQIYTVIILTWPVLSLLIFAAGVVIYLRRKHL